MIRRLLFLLCIGAVATLFVRTYVIEGIYIASGSMEPTLPVKTFLFLEKISYRLHPPKRGDIVVFPSPVEQGRDLAKRVIAVESDTIEIRNKDVFLNGAPLNEEYVVHVRGAELLAGDTLGPFEVPEGMAFVMGDNRDVSGDSRDWKDQETGDHIYFIPVSSIKGKVILLY